VRAWEAAVAADPPWAMLDDPALWDAVLDLEPAGCRLPLDEGVVDAVAETFADFADLKAFWLTGHSRAVAALAAGAARRVGLPAAEQTRLQRAGLLHDLGRAAIPSSVHDKPRALTPAEWEAVRLHPYHAERILARVPPLADLAALAGSHHERLDGSGFHRAAAAAQLPVSSRLIAAADAYEMSTRATPYRPARAPEGAAALLREEARRGRLDSACVEAVVDEARGAPRQRRRATGRLSEREAEVLERIALGAATRDVAAELGITDKTVRHHLEHIYDKLGVGTRTAAAMRIRV
jgi:HD-GYP domain-containing protein (c-di-GMP phosphodiesterase class II)